jgi:pilus assembly protein CpaF
MNNDLDLLISFLQPIKELLLDDTVSEIMGNQYLIS